MNAIDIALKEKTFAKYWQYAIADNTECCMAKDGGLFAFHLHDIKCLLDSYPSDHTSDFTVWYFDNTKNKEIAHIHRDFDWVLVYVDPQFVWWHFKKVML